MLLYEVLQWFSAFAEIYLCYCFIDILEDRGYVERNRILVCEWSLGTGFILALNRTGNGSLLSWLMLLIQSLLIFLSVLRCTKGEKIFCFNIIIAYNVCLAFLQLVFACGMITWLSIGVEEVYFKCGIYKSGCCLLALIVMSIVYQIILRYRKRNIISLKAFKWTFLIYGMAGICLIAGFQNQLLTYGKSKSAENLFFLSMVVGATFFMLIGTIKSVQTKAELESLEFKSRLLEDNYKEIQSMYQDFVYTYHDMKNHLIVLENYCKAGDMEKAVGYIENIQEPIRKIKSYFNSGNKVLDIILNFKLSTAEQKGILVEVVMDITDEIRLEEKDLCAIFSNLLDNAIEACEFIKKDKKWIRVLVKDVGDMFLINIVNSCTDEHNEDRKVHPGIHGYGLKSVKAIAEQYGGEVMWKQNDGVFIVTVTFFNNNIER